MDERIPKYIFDKEYATQWRREVQFLTDKGVKYTYAKKHPKYGIVTYKYTKVPELFLALAEFYNQIRNEQYFKNYEVTSSKVETSELPIEKGYIELKPEELSDGEKKLMNIKEEDVLDVITEDDTE